MLNTKGVGLSLMKPQIIQKITQKNSKNVMNLKALWI